MMKFRIEVILVFLLVFLADIQAQPLPAKTRHNIIIDSDCAVDDLRSISLLLSRPEITIEGILISDGSLLPAEGLLKVRSLLHAFNRDSIPVAAGVTLKGNAPPWREFNRKVDWSNTQIKDPGNTMSAVDCLSQILQKTTQKIVLVCLGPLTQEAALIKKDPRLLPEIEKIIWYNDSATPLQGFNYEYDKAAADVVFSANIRIDVISNLSKPEAFFDSALVAVSHASDTKLATTINYLFSQPIVTEKLKQNHFRLCDDLAALYLITPELFDINTMLHKVKIRYSQDYDVKGAREALCDMMKGSYVAQRNVVFNKFPDQREWFRYDVRPIMDSAIALYGYDEWKANVMTDEFHGHLGVFSIVGAKMGIKARELFGAGPDELSVVSFAGSKPPYSCMNDGVQVSTGATLGMGTIHLAQDSLTAPSAIFTLGKRSIRITLKKEYLDRVNADINEGIVKYGLMDDVYWKLIRRNALKYWLEWDRNKIFDIVEISK
jgi:pyrimidine-specific ribonucleoside hydrolase